MSIISKIVDVIRGAAGAVRKAAGAVISVAGWIIRTAWKAVVGVVKVAVKVVTYAKSAIHSALEQYVGKEFADIIMVVGPIVLSIGAFRQLIGLKQKVGLGLGMIDLAQRAGQVAMTAAATASRAIAAVPAAAGTAWQLWSPLPGIW